ncbi:hypothetical protein BDR06DRAFT_978229 [Suillus hirtellus]|nr:hypothetical protein BDR06DRAFT_978229 [Suillus hirtellus]
MGSLQLRTDPVLHQKRFLSYETFKLSLHPYWKVGALMDGWFKLFNLLWPTKEDARMINVKRSSLTHTALIGVIREMILLIPPADDGAPSKAVVDDARQRNVLRTRILADLYRKQPILHVTTYGDLGPLRLPLVILQITLPLAACLAVLGNVAKFDSNNSFVSSCSQHLRYMVVSNNAVYITWLFVAINERAVGATIAGLRVSSTAKVGIVFNGTWLEVRMYYVEEYLV